MNRRWRAAAPLLLGLALPGCVASAIAGATVAAVKAPFKVGGAVIDATTTSRAEADRNRGRALRKQEEAAAREAKRTRRAAERFARRDAETAPR
ncbi:hypothetical protein IP88_03530 [alpha proteobacterium AAP81b]|nr:hypothetical protein IP88_03530 [alpha proteobacterium AAP81b]